MLTAVTLSSPACVLCGRVDNNPPIFGKRYEMYGMCFHAFCVVSSLEAPASFLQPLCFVCGNLGATITCAEAGCDRSFHFPCASEGQCVTQHFGQYSTRQSSEKRPVGDSRSYSTMVCPSCQHAWFHRACIQVGALPFPHPMGTSAGLRCFQCPLCRDREKFIQEMINLGIHIPVRKPKWETNRAYASLGVRHRHCDASNCLYPQGREQAEREGPWQLLLCSSCAAQGTHRCCSNLGQSTTTWECNACAGEGTGKRQTVLPHNWHKACQEEPALRSWGGLEQTPGRWQRKKAKWVPEAPSKSSSAAGAARCLPGELR
uniref:Zinc finger PHD-type domain-containing protein n=1 Tax=Gallus gallus TaxID=9031 RepID=A0A8V1AGG9_CHICK